MYSVPSSITVTVREGLLRAYGVSVETVSEALTAIRHPGVTTVQMIFNAFRLKPAEDFFARGGRGHYRPGAPGERPADR
ncbi:hypothetical protein [Deinococcus hopiensis]|uniref:hypothetical protein n=1 Tax=Deinococcus hopiensis TaxID=309885 RepID=UPI001FE47D26|nr:hypothetical protein [Deinococcus hopiensis]